MRILVYGAGIIGSIYAAKLHNSGYEVTLLARGKRYETLAQTGIILFNVQTLHQIISPVPLTKQLTDSDYYDIIILAVRLDQLESALKELEGYEARPLVILMLNNPGNLEDLSRRLFPKFIMIAFPGVAGVYNNHVIDYLEIKQQKTTIGNIDGRKNQAIRTVEVMFGKAGFKVAINDKMGAWLKTHAVFITCASAAILREQGDPVRLGKNRESVRFMVSSIREGFAALRKLDIPIVPSNLRIIFLIMPRWFSILYWQRALQGKTGTLAIAPHANAARKEIKVLAEKVLEIVHSSALPTPSIDKLLAGVISQP